MAAPKLVVAVKSCQRDHKLGFHDAIRETWGRALKSLGVEVKFFMGHSGVNGVKGHMQSNETRELITLQKDETFVDAPDDYMSLPLKTRGICKWVADRMISHLFVCDNDTIIIRPKLFLDIPYQIFDYGGSFFMGNGTKAFGQTFSYTDGQGTYPAVYPWASGGRGYFLSKKAAMIVADTFPKFWAEDMYVGSALGPHSNDLFFGPLTMSEVVHYKKSAAHPVFTPDLLRETYKIYS